MIDTNAIPPTPQPEHIVVFKAHFSESATDADLQHVCNGKQLIKSNLVEIGSLISPATQKRITSAVMTLSDSPGLSAIDQQWLDSLWNEEMMTLASLTHTP